MAVTEPLVGSAEPGFRDPRTVPGLALGALNQVERGGGGGIGGGGSGARWAFFSLQMRCSAGTARHLSRTLATDFSPEMKHLFAPGTLHLMRFAEDPPVDLSPAAVTLSSTPLGAVVNGRAVVGFPLDGGWYWRHSHSKAVVR